MLSSWLKGQSHSLQTGSICKYFKQETRMSAHGKQQVIAIAPISRMTEKTVSCFRPQRQRFGFHINDQAKKLIFKDKIDVIHPLKPIFAGVQSTCLNNKTEERHGKTLKEQASTTISFVVNCDVELVFHGKSFLQSVYLQRDQRLRVQKTARRPLIWLWFVSRTQIASKVWSCRSVVEVMVCQMKKAYM